jgi:hypothetical protein
MVTTTAAQAASTTIAQARATTDNRMPGIELSFSLLFGVGVWASRRRMHKAGFFLLMIAVLTVGTVSCGGGSGGGSSGGGGGGGGTPITSTPAGTYSLTINGSSGGFSTTYALQLTVH